MGKYLALLREKFPADFAINTTVNGDDFNAVPAKAARVGSEISRVKILDMENAVRDRVRRRGYDFDRTAPGHAEFMEGIFADFDRTIASVNDLQVPQARLADAQRILSAYTVIFDKCFEDRDWGELRDAFDRFQKETRDLCR
jgi:hypothetical protein